MRSIALHTSLLVAALSLGCTKREGPAPQEAPPPPARAEEARPGAPQTGAAELDTEEARRLRASLVDRLARGGLVRDAKVLATLREVPRHAFVPGMPLARAYADSPQPIGHDQTISQPLIVGMMTQALELTGRERVLEIGTGSGYQAAILSKLAGEVYTIELVAPLGEDARARLARLGFANVKARIGDGYKGWPEKAPFDRIVLTAAPEELPQALLDQLGDGGVLVAPVGPLSAQELVRYRKTGGKLQKDTLAPVHFVPMVPGK
jgi:protein-L-isoaspartate(D-aspartate) O-methyltransferase